ncbi:suppressor of fused domain protein [Pseudarthrobacter equi]|uniref:suppressor of fused domain protein n=1 Tax=Pseudarthrobacter equi TaxID=728066 RepID=UPI0021BE555C|nr:suppressor of fused domain protein [Pseudarthrobacter equi]
MTHLVEHLEQYLGPISGGWSRDADGRPAHAQVVKFDDGPLDGVVAYSTLGLSRRSLAVSGRAPIRIELLMMVRRGHFERYIPSMMQQLAEEMIHEGRAPLRGEVTGPRGPLDPDTGLEAFLVYSPYYQPDGFAVCEDVDGPIIIANLVPLFPAEATSLRPTAGRRWRASWWSTIRTLMTGCGLRYRCTTLKRQLRHAIVRNKFREIARQRKDRAMESISWPRAWQPEAGRRKPVAEAGKRRLPRLAIHDSWTPTRGVQ